MMKVVIRTCFGITFRSEETNRLEPSRTKAVAPTMATLLMAELVTASAGHSPSRWTNTGFSFQNPLPLVVRLIAGTPLLAAPTLAAVPVAAPSSGGVRSTAHSPR